jgi:hypothetical protein
VVPPADLDECRTPTFEMYAALQPTCAGCHGDGTSVPSFASLAAFENLIAYNPRIVAPGDPAASELVRLLEGRGTGTLPQMPLGEASFADLDERGETQVSVGEVKAWVRDLEVCDVPASHESPLAAPITVEQLRNQLHAQLGLTREDTASLFPIESPHAIEQLPRNRDARSAHRRWMAMGGPNHLSGSARRQEISPLLVQQLFAVSQSWCRKSVREQDTLFRHATRDSQSGTDEAAIRQNIEYLYLHMLGVVASAEEVDAMYQEIYRHYEPQGAEVAWTAVCATFVRDPLWLTY